MALNEVYVISLDAVDLNLLPVIQKSTDRVVPLWTRSNLDMRSNEYYEFKINTNEDTQPEDKKIPVIEYVVCDICDIDVPKRYLNEHKNSFKHRFNKKIADVALKRLQLFMNRQDDADSDNNETDPSTYYCPECSIIVDCKDEISHRRSITHKHSVLLERFLRDFLHFYTNDDKLIEKQENAPETEIKRDNCLQDTKQNEPVVATIENEVYKETLEKEPIVSPLKTKSKNDDFAQESIEKAKTLIGAKEKHHRKEIFNVKPLIAPDTHIKNDDLVQENIKKNNTLINATDKQNKEIIQKELPVPPTNKPNITINDYLTLLTRKFNTLPMSFKVIGDEIEIKTIDGSKVRVCEENFYGLTTIGSFQYCMICECLFPLKNRDGHLLGDQHMKIMSLPLEDKHCIRKIYSGSSHCLICNITIQNTFFHQYNSFKHLENLEKILKSDTDEENDDNKDTKNMNVNKKAIKPELYNNAIEGSTSDESRTNTNTKNENATALADQGNVSNKNPNISSDTDEKSGKRFCDICNVKISIRTFTKHENTMKHTLNKMSDYHYMMKAVNGDHLDCKICKVTVKNSVSAVEYHCKNDDHINKYNQLLKINSIIITDSFIYNCMKCEKRVLHKNEILHIESKEHKCKIDFDDKLADMIDRTEQVIDEEVKTSEIVVDETEKTEETASNNTEKSEESFLDKIKLKESVSSAYYFCDICQVKVPNNKNNIEIHVTGKPHKNKLKTSEADENTKEATSVGKIPNLHYQMVESKAGFVKCLICNVGVANKEEIIFEHLASDAHTSNYSDFFEYNMLFHLDNNIYCALCAVEIGVRCEISHCIGKKHMKFVDENSKQF